jgi:hypothetical protein
LILNHFLSFRYCPLCPKIGSVRGKTVTKLHQLTVSVSNRPVPVRLPGASRFICISSAHTSLAPSCAPAGQLSHPLVRHTAGAQARRVRGTEVVDSEVWHQSSPQKRHATWSSEPSGVRPGSHHSETTTDSFLRESTDPEAA